MDIRHRPERPRHEERGWRRGGRGPRAGRGDVRLAALSLLATQPMHGYQLIQEIGERSGGAWEPSPGAVYPALQLLEDQGLIQAEETEGRRVYYLTDSGRSLVEERQEELSSLWQAVRRSADDETTELRDLYGQLGAAVRQVAHEGTPAEVAEAKKLLVTARKQLYRILADTQDSTYHKEETSNDSDT